MSELDGNESRTKHGNEFVDLATFFLLAMLLVWAIPSNSASSGRQRKERILAQAHEEADRIRNLAKQEASELVNREVITSSAQQRADHILERAGRDAITIRQDADVYVMEVLANLEEDLLRSVAVVRNGLHKLTADQAVMQAEVQEEEVVKAQAAD